MKILDIKPLDIKACLEKSEKDFEELTPENLDPVILADEVRYEENRTVYYHFGKVIGEIENRSKKTKK